MENLSSVVETCDALEQVKKSAKIKTETGKNELEENAQQKCFQLRLDIPGEGNCMFHALLDQLARFGIERIIEPQLLRKKLVDFLQENSNLVSILGIGACVRAWRGG